MRRLSRIAGYTITEMMIAMFITGVIAAAAFEFYASMHNSTLAQEEISDMQQTSRVTLAEISKTLRMAGYKTGTHPAFAVNGDSLYVFFNGSQPIDTVLYYLADYTEDTLTLFTDELMPRMLMKKVNSDPPAVFSEFIRDITFTVVNPNTVTVAIEVITTKPDEDFDLNSGFRTAVAAENVNLRNTSL